MSEKFRAPMSPVERLDSAVRELDMLSAQRNPKGRLFYPLSATRQTEVVDSFPLETHVELEDQYGAFRGFYQSKFQKTRSATAEFEFRRYNRLYTNQHNRVMNFSIDEHLILLEACFGRLNYLIGLGKHGKYYEADFSSAIRKARSQRRRVLKKIGRNRSNPELKRVMDMLDPEAKPLFKPFSK